MHLRRTFFFACLIVTLISTAAVRADFTVTGRFRYQDLEIDLNGFTGVRPDRPIRLADVLILDDVTGVVLAQGATDLNGEFSIAVSDNQIRTISVVVVANSSNTPGLYQAVMVLVSRTINGTTPHAFEGGLYPDHSPNQNIDMGTAVAQYRAGGEPFNIYDNMLDNADFLRVVNGARPPASIKTITNFNINYAGDFAYHVSGRGVFLGQNYGYDDTIILHELGHYIERNFGDFDDNPGGAHFLGDSAQDPRLSWGEGWATFWGSHVRLWRGDLHPNVYVNSVGDSTPNRISFSYDLEGRRGEGASSENAVQSALWDMTDGPSTPDFTPGEDDEPEYEMTRTFDEMWLIISLFVSTVGEPQTFEDFFAMWNANITNPQTETLRELLVRNHSIQYLPDEFEGDNEPAQAVRLSFAQVGGGAVTHHTHYPEGDEDWLVFEAFASVKYAISTNTMRDGADTYISVHDANRTPLAANDNVATPPAGENNAFEALRSSVEYRPAQNGPLFIRSRRSPSNSNSKFGHYNLLVSAVEVGPEAPNLQLSSASIIVSAPKGETRERTFVITNTGTRDTLDYKMEEQQRDFTPFDFPWLTASPMTGRLSPGASDTIEVLLESGPAAIGQNVARLEIQSNDPNNAVRPVAIVLNVTQPTAVDDEPVSVLPSKFALGQSYPNPFVPANGAAPQGVRITYEIPAQARGGVPVTLRIYDVLGREVRTLTNEIKPPGSFVARWDGRDERGALVGNGVYLYKITAADFSAVRKLIVVR
jgi:hypothetical protein